jgi:trimethylamine:corrinoid methyltransferase-like protein
MPAELKPLEPIKTPYRLRYLSDADLKQLQDATLSIMERTGVRFPSEKALKVLADHGAKVDFEKQVMAVLISPPTAAGSRPSTLRPASGDPPASRTWA